MIRRSIIIIIIIIIIVIIIIIILAIKNKDVNYNHTRSTTNFSLLRKNFGITKVASSNIMRLRIS